MQEITIQFIDEDIKGVWKGWCVVQGDKYADGLSWDEMLGLIASLTIPQEKPCIHWLKTKQEHATGVKR